MSAPAIAVRPEPVADRYLDTRLAPLRVIPIPELGPPASEREIPRADRGGPFQTQLDLVFPEPAPPPRRRRASAYQPDELFEPQPTPTALLPEADEWAARMVVALVEVAAGSRAATQVMRFTAPQVYDSLLRRQSRAIRRGQATRRPRAVQSVRVCHVTDGSVEVAAVVRDGPRVRAVALRLDGCDHRWIVTALQLG